MGNKCECRFCQETYPAIKRMREYLKPEDLKAVENALESSMTHETDYIHEREHRKEAEAKAKVLGANLGSLKEEKADLQKKIERCRLEDRRRAESWDEWAHDFAKKLGGKNSEGTPSHRNITFIEKKVTEMVAIISEAKRETTGWCTGGYPAPFAALAAKLFQVFRKGPDEPLRFVPCPGCGFEIPSAQMPFRRCNKKRMGEDKHAAQ